MRTPARRHFSTTSRCQSTANQSRMDRGDRRAHAVGGRELLLGRLHDAGPSSGSRGPAPARRWARRAGWTAPPAPARAGRPCGSPGWPAAWRRWPRGVPSFFVKNADRCSASASRKKTSPSSCEQAALQERDRRLVAEVLDVEGAAAGDVEDPLPQLRGARPGVGAADVGVALLLRAQLGAALGAVRRHLERALGAVARGDDRAEDLGDDVAGLADDDGVADQHALALDLATRCAGWPAARWSRPP